MLDGPPVHHVVLAVSFPRDLSASHVIKPGIPLVRHVHTKRIGGKKTCGRLFAYPIEIKTMQRFKDACLHGIEHLKRPYNGASRECFKNQFTFRSFSHLFAEFLNFNKTYGTCIPCRL